MEKNPTPLTNPEVLTILKERIESASVGSIGALNSEQEVKISKSFVFQSFYFSFLLKFLSFFPLMYRYYIAAYQITGAQDSRGSRHSL